MRTSLRYTGRVPASRKRVEWIEEKGSEEKTNQLAAITPRPPSVASPLGPTCRSMFLHEKRRRHVALLAEEKEKTVEEE